MDSEDSIHKKPRMEEDKDITEDVEPIKIVSLKYFRWYFVIFLLCR